MAALLCPDLSHEEPILKHIKTRGLQLCLGIKVPNISEYTLILNLFSTDT